MGRLRIAWVKILTKNDQSLSSTNVYGYYYDVFRYGEYGLIGMTEPRRIAAISSAERIRYELSMEEPLVAHHIRYECKTTEETKIAVMTDGVLLNEVSSDFLLQKYSGLFLPKS